VRLCVASHKPVWRSRQAAGGFATDGGFPLQMEAISSLFDKTELVVCERPAPSDGSGTPLPSRGVRVVPVREPRGSDLTRKLFLAGSAAYYLARLAPHIARADVVHAVVPGDLGMLGMLLALAMRKRLFVRYCSSWQETSRTTRANRLCKQLMVRHAGGRNVMFATGLGETPPDGPGGRLKWIFATSLWAADLAALAQVPGTGGGGPVAESTGTAPCRLLYLGRLSPEKGLLNLLEALVRLEKGAVHLRLAGHGPQLGLLQEQVRHLGLDEHVRFTGLLDRAGVVRELAAADLFVLPSLTESFGKVVVEALAAGLPVIASGVGAIPTILGSDEELGLVVPPGDVDALARAIGTLAADPARRQAMRARGSHRVRDWSLEAWAAQIGAALEEAWGCALKSSPYTGNACHVSSSS
jgi:hypothetical protein